MRSFILDPDPHNHMLGNDRIRCPGCGLPFQAADVVTLIEIGPGDDAEERAKARSGRAYNAVAIPAHLGCVTGDEP